MSLEDKIIHETSIGYVFKVKKNYFEVRINRDWDSISDSAYVDVSIAVARLDYLTNNSVNPLALALDFNADIVHNNGHDCSKE